MWGACSPQKIDGVDIRAILKGDVKASPSKHFNYYYRYNSLEAKCLQNWKLVLDYPGQMYEGFAYDGGDFQGLANEQDPIKTAILPFQARFKRAIRRAGSVPQNHKRATAIS